MHALSTKGIRLPAAKHHVLASHTKLLFQFPLGFQLQRLQDFLLLSRWHLLFLRHSCMMSQYIAFVKQQKTNIWASMRMARTCKHSSKTVAGTYCTSSTSLPCLGMRHSKHPHFAGILWPFHSPLPVLHIGGWDHALQAYAQTSTHKGTKKTLHTSININSTFFLCTLVTFTYWSPPSHSNIKKLCSVWASVFRVIDGLPASPSATSLILLPGHNTQHSDPARSSPCLHWFHPS